MGATLAGAAMKKSGIIFAVAAAVVLVIIAMVSSLGCGSGAVDKTEANTINTAADGKAISVYDIKLIADFPHEILFTRGKRIGFDELLMGGGAHIDPGQGLAVYKGGINEVIDPSFEGSGWQLGPEAVIDSGVANVGRRSLRINGDGSSQVVAQLKEPVKVVSGETRTLSFSHLCDNVLAGNIKVVLDAIDADGNVIGIQSSSLAMNQKVWQRSGGFIDDLPAGTSSYTIKIIADGFVGTSHLDAFLVEPKDFFTPYFDGDSENCMWVDAATPQNFTADRNQVNTRLLLKGTILSALAMGVVAASSLMFVNGFFRRRYSWMLISPLIAIPVVVLIMVLLGVSHIPNFLPYRFTLPGSHLQSDHMYYYRISSVDAEGRESPPSIENRVRSGWLERKTVLTWDRDPGAVKYRIYRGDSSYEQNLYYELDGNNSTFVDTGAMAEPGQPMLELGVDSATPNASRSLRPEPEARVSNTKIGLDTSDSFWVTGEVEFGFSSDRPFKPASMFEIGNPDAEDGFAVSVRYFPEWGDEYAKILLIKNKSEGDYDYTSEPLPPIHPGSVLRYAAALLYQPNDDLSAGAHLWYRIDNGEVHHMTFESPDVLAEWPLIRISKRYYYDDFGNNSICRSFAIVQGKVDNSMVESIMGPGAVPERLGIMASVKKPGDFPGNQNQ